MRKSALRKQFLLLRRALSPTDRAEQSQRITAQLQQFLTYQQAKRLGVYYALSDEVDTKQIIDLALEQGKTVYLPVSHPLGYLAAYDRQTPLRCEAGFQEPASPNQAYCLPQDVSLILVPLLAFDSQGNRLGRGGGFYDRLLAPCGKDTFLLGLAFDCQAYPGKLPITALDKPLDGILTPQGLHPLKG